MSQLKVNVPLEIKGNIKGLKKDFRHQMGFIYKFSCYDFQQKFRQSKKTLLSNLLSTLYWATDVHLRRKFFNI